MGTHFSRRRYIVDWKLQGSLCMHGLVHGGLVLAAIVAGIFVPLLWDLGADVPAYETEQAIVMLYMHERLWLLALGCGVIVVLSAVKLSHRIAGPLVRYKRNLRLLADGKLPTPLRTRSGDYLKEEVACLNAAVAGIATRVEAIRQAQSVLRGEMAAVLARTSTATAGQFDGLIAASRHLEECVAAIAPFDPGDDRLPEPGAAPVVALAGAAGRNP